MRALRLPSIATNCSTIEFSAVLAVSPGLVLVCSEAILVSKRRNSSVKREASGSDFNGTSRLRVANENTLRTSSEASPSAAKRDKYSDLPMPAVFGRNRKSYLALAKSFSFWLAVAQSPLWNSRPSLLRVLRASVYRFCKPWRTNRVAGLLRDPSITICTLSSAKASCWLITNALANADEANGRLPVSSACKYTSIGVMILFCAACSLNAPYGPKIGLVTESSKPRRYSACSAEVLLFAIVPRVSNTSRVVIALTWFTSSS